MIPGAFQFGIIRPFVAIQEQNPNPQVRTVAIPALRDQFNLLRSVRINCPSRRTTLSYFSNGCAAVRACHRTAAQFDGLLTGHSFRLGVLNTPQDAARRDGVETAISPCIDNLDFSMSAQDFAILEITVQQARTADRRSRN
ncbi:hypothetical protein [Novosphingobium kaempferiae]|uniref:hypothetical protein n=1 Tax=Novosphingobium kaempferiae TaxID=2896849 RepID=UPI001E410CED|nr:hypothetical protein [Novosphingobium kaempferiae]